MRMPHRSRRTLVVCSRSSPGRGMTGLSALESSKTTYSERRERSPPRAVSCSRAPPRDRGGFFVKSCEVERAQGGGNFAAFFWSLPPLRQKAKNVLLHEFSYPAVNFNSKSDSAKQRELAGFPGALVARACAFTLVLARAESSR